ncbi:MAG TPA: hypothetical protein VGE39_00725 [Prosthecobacter sp.]
MAPANSVNTQPQATSFRLWAKTRLLEKGLSVSALAKNLQLARNTVSIAINHDSMFPNVKERIKEALA